MSSSQLLPRTSALRRAASVAAAGLAFALAAPPAEALPTREAGSLPGGGAPAGVALSDDDRYIGIAEADGDVFIWDSGSFSAGPTLAAACEDGNSIAFATGSAAGTRFYIGCDGGEVVVLDVDDETVPPTVRIVDSIVLNSGNGDVSSLHWAPGDSYLHAVVEHETSISIFRIQVSSGAPSAAPLTAVGSGNSRGAAFGESGSPLVVGRSDSFINWYGRDGDAYAADSFSIPLASEIEDVAVSNEIGLIFIADSGSDAIYAMDDGGGLSVDLFVEVDDPVVIERGPGGSGDVLWVATEGGMLEAFDAGGQNDASIELDGGVPVDLVPSSDSDGPLYLVDGGGSLRVISDAPFLSGVSVSPDRVGANETFELTFTSSLTGSWQVEVNGTLQRGSGDVIATGDAAAEEEVKVVLNSSSLDTEGANRLYVFVDRDGAVGVDSGSIVLDTPPGPVRNVAVGPGDSRLTLSWTAGAEGDIDHFEVFLSDATFSATSSELPTYELEDDAGEVVSYPREVTAGEAGGAHSVSVEGIGNGTTWFLAVRAVDDGGLEGPLSDIVAGTPEQTCGAAECSGDTGGCTCAAVAMEPDARLGGLALALFVSAAMPLARRRRARGGSLAG